MRSEVNGGLGRWRGPVERELRAKLSDEDRKALAERVKGMGFEEIEAYCAAALKALQPVPVAVLATSNPEVPLDRQRERLSEAQKRLIADEERKFKEWEEEKRRDRWVAERQAAIDFHMEMRLAEARAERRFRRELDPYGLGLYGAEPFHKGE
jgi:SpoVK/Ycf46/Vps4 family AAA+-type ATPase